MVVDEATATPRYAKFITEPWENGFGHTLGNALRRVLLTKMEGIAVKAIRIEGIAHEFCSIPNVMEDVMEIVLNIKQLKFQCDGSLPRTLELVANKAGEVTAANIKEDGCTTVLNKDLVLFTLDKSKPIRMELDIDKGRGYRPSEENKSDDQPINTIPVDCLFSPIEKVHYEVQGCRVGQQTDYDRLELEVWTDGRIDPKEAVACAAMLLREHLAVFCDSSDLNLSAPSKLSEEDEALLQKLCTNVNNLDLPVRAVNCLTNAEINFVGELVEKSESMMMKYRNFGKKSLQEIVDKLQEMGLNLEMTLKNEIKEEMNRRLANQLKSSEE